MENGYTILLVDDQSIFLDGIESLLAQVPGARVVGKAHNGVEAVRLAKELRPNVVLMDINMPGMDGIEATRRIRITCPDTHILVLSMYGHREFVLELLDSGVSGYLLKTTTTQELHTALGVVSRGGRFIARELDLTVLEGDRIRDREGETVYGSLTKREIEVVRLILRERTTQEIADALFVSVGTVETHRRNIMHKLDVRNTAGLVKYAVERGWGH